MSTVIFGCDTVAQVEKNVQIARDFTPPSEERLKALAAKTEEVKRQALRKWQA